MPRSTRDVFEDHLRLRSAGDLEADLQRNYADDVVLICGFGALRGRDAIRESADRLRLQLRGHRFEFLSKQTADDYAYLEWRAEGDAVRLEDGADSFVIRDGRIVMQTIHYREVRGQA